MIAVSRHGTLRAVRGAGKAGEGDAASLPSIGYHPGEAARALPGDVRALAPEIPCSEIIRCGTTGKLFGCDKLKKEERIYVVGKTKAARWYPGSPQSEEIAAQ